MSSHVGVSVGSGSSRTVGCGNEDTSEENRSSEANSPCMTAVRPRLRSAELAGEGRSSNVEQLERPALFGRKAQRKTCKEDNRERWREGRQEREEERSKPDHFGGKERARHRQRKMETVKSHSDGAQETQSRGNSDSFSGSNSDIQLNNILEGGDVSNKEQMHNPCARPQSAVFTQTSLSYSSTRPAVPTRPTPLPSQRLSSRSVAGDLHPQSLNSTRDSFWAEVRTGAACGPSSQNISSQTHTPAVSISESQEEQEDEFEDDVEDEEEEGRGVTEVTGQSITLLEALPCIPFEERRMTKREKSRIKSLRRRQRRRERWRQSPQQDSRQLSEPTTSSSSSSEDEEALNVGDREGFICAVCLDVYFSPYMCHPCNHIFCEPCLRTLAKNSPTNTPCPLCRTIITHVFFQKELNQTAKTFFPKEYLSRKQNFQKASCAKWPLPSCRKVFRIFGGFQRPSNQSPRRRFPHAGGYHLDAVDFEDDSRGWRFDMDMVIIYIYSVNWIIGFFIFCFLCYLFLPSF